MDAITFINILTLDAMYSLHFNSYQPPFSTFCCTLTLASGHSPPISMICWARGPSMLMVMLGPCNERSPTTCSTPDVFIIEFYKSSSRGHELTPSHSRIIFGNTLRGSILLQRSNNSGLQSLDLLNNQRGGILTAAFNYSSQQL
jgi:hypothetical protein